MSRSIKLYKHGQHVAIEIEGYGKLYIDPTSAREMSDHLDKLADEIQAGGWTNGLCFIYPKGFAP